MIPIANLLFTWTNIIGCALWVADEIEKDEAQRPLQGQYGSTGSSSSFDPTRPYIPPTLNQVD
jgi:hypothetical protein